MTTEKKSQLVELADYQKVCQNMLLTEQEVGGRGLNKILEGISENSSFEIDDSTVTSEANNLLKDYEEQLRYQGQNLLDYVNEQGMTINELKERLKSQARDKIQKELILEAIAEQEKIEVSETELHAEVHEVAKVHHIDFGAAWEKLELEGDIEKLERKLLLEKTIEFLSRLANIS